MQNHKGSVPALLTLGLVLIGSLVTIGISYLTSNNKIASNPKAQTTIEPCKTGFYAKLDGGDGSGCKPVCGDDCEPCMWAGEQKYQCGVAANPPPNLGSCNKSRTYASKNNCLSEHKNGPCTQCMMSQTVRWENDDNGTDSTKGGGEKLGELCLISETEAGTDYYCKGANLKCSAQNAKGTCIKDEGSKRTGKLGDLCQTIETELGTQYYCKDVGLKCSSEDAKGTCIEDKGKDLGCTKHFGFKCSSAGYTGSTKTFDYYKSAGVQDCLNNTVGGPCYGTTVDSCSTQWSEFVKSQCEETVPPANDPNSICETAYPGIDSYCQTGPFNNHPCREGYEKKEDNLTCFTGPLGGQKKCCVKIVENDGNTPTDKSMPPQSCDTIQCPEGKTGEYYLNTEQERYYASKKECTENNTIQSYNEKDVESVACWLSASSNTGETQTAQEESTSTVFWAGDDCGCSMIIDNKQICIEYISYENCK